MRTFPWFLVAVLAGCHPSASVERTMPVANLQSYRTVALRVQSSVFASQGHAMYLEAAVLQKLKEKCGFEQAGRPGATPADVVLDLNITKIGRGGGGWVSNSSRADIDTLLVLTEGQSGDLLGTARIHGQSSGMILNGASPENEAFDVVAASIADLLATSGCSGKRIAKQEPVAAPIPDPGTGTARPVDEAKRAEADGLNEQGKEKLRNADVPGALAAFQQANTLAPDARYEFNICLAFATDKRWSDATSSCQRARGMNPPPALLTKIDRRLDLLAHQQ